MSDPAPQPGKLHRALQAQGNAAPAPKGGDGGGRPPNAKLAQLFASTVMARSEEAALNALRAECAAVEDGPFRAGDIIGGQYEVQTIHRGGFGLVYICRQLGPEQYARSGNLVALKTPLPRHLGSPELREMFIAEAAHCVALGPHPNLVLTYGVTEYNRLPYLVMEYVPEARSLQGEIIAGKTDWTTTLPAGLGIARGLAFAKLVHGDLKPVNILLGADGAAKVADFGLALSVDDPSDPSVLAGTRGFYAPEMLQGRPARSVATDLYAYGVVLYVSATGYFPFPSDPPDLNTRLPAPNPRELRPEIPDEFARLVLRCLERDPARRPPSFAAVAVELERLHPALLHRPAPADPVPDIPARSDALVNAAQSWMNLGRLAQAKTAAREAIDLQAGNWKAHQALGLVLAAANDQAGALASFSAAHEIAPEAIPPISSAAVAAYTLGRREQARSWLERALRICTQTENFAALDTCSFLALELLEEKPAYNLIHRILTDAPAAAMTWNTRAVLMRRMGAYDQALASADRALALNPTYAKAYVQRANALIHLGQMPEALESANRALALDSSLAGAHAAKYSALMSQGKRAEARACVDRGLALLPGNPLLLQALDKLK